MNSYEKESLVKNFLIFFSLLELLLLLLFLELYRNQIGEYKQKLYKDMEVCSYTLKCNRYKIGFAPKDKNHLQHLYEKSGLYAFFRVPKSKKYDMKLFYAQKSYERDKAEIVQELGIKFIVSTLLLLGVAFLLTLYSLKPLRKALKVNDEFIKDVLHDFNTPITSMVLNLSMLDKKEQENPFVKRVSQGLDTIVLLQNNLKAFLASSPSHNSCIDVALVAKERLEFMATLYPNISFIYEKNSALIKVTNQDLIIRIFDNLISNASKYNRPKGEVKLIVNDNLVTIEDTGKGIQDTSKVLERYHTEQERGLGIGLHVVNKLTQELGIVMKIESQVGVGTKITLDFSHVAS